MPGSFYSNKPSCRELYFLLFFRMHIFRKFPCHFETKFLQKIIKFQIFLLGCLPYLLFTCESCILWKCPSQMVSGSTASLSKRADYSSRDQIRFARGQRDYWKTQRETTCTHHVPTSKLYFSKLIKIFFSLLVMLMVKRWQKVLMLVNT